MCSPAKDLHAGGTQSCSHCRRDVLHLQVLPLRVATDRYICFTWHAGMLTLYCKGPHTCGVTLRQRMSLFWKASCETLSICVRLSLLSSHAVHKRLRPARCLGCEVCVMWHVDPAPVNDSVAACLMFNLRDYTNPKCMQAPKLSMAPRHIVAPRIQLTTVKAPSLSALLCITQVQRTPLSVPFHGASVPSENCWPKCAGLPTCTRCVMSACTAFVGCCATAAACSMQAKWKALMPQCLYWVAVHSSCTRLAATLPYFGGFRST